MPYQIINGVRTWVNWTSTYLQNATVTNSSDPIGGMLSAVNPAVPIFWPTFSILVYLFLLFSFREAPPRWKWPGICAIAALFSLIMAWTGYLPDAVLNVVVFGFAILISTVFKT